jgi:two-component system sensor histidine kinase TctE
VIDPKGALIAGYPGLEASGDPPADFAYNFFDTMFRTEAMRTAILRQPVTTPDGSRTVTVLVGETKKARDDLFRNLWIRGFFEQSALVLAAALSIWIGINRELRPVLNLRQDVLDRPSDRFEPFDAAAVQTELRPLVMALNSHMERLEQQLVRRRHFLDTAAHQLRTPLAVMKTQVGYARRAGDNGESGAALTQVDANLTAMARLTNQLLMLGRVEDDRAALQMEVIDFANVVRDVLAEAAPRALDHEIELVLEVAGPCPVIATATLARELVANLIDNAIAHAGPGATATVRVATGDEAVVVEVADNGIGIDAADRENLFVRFRRGRNAGPGGSGLGLAIVAEIAEIFSGAVELPPPTEGCGFRIRVSLPKAAGPSTFPGAVLLGQAVSG